MFVGVFNILLRGGGGHLLAVKRGGGRIGNHKNYLGAFRAGCHPHPDP